MPIPLPVASSPRSLPVLLLHSRPFLRPSLPCSLPPLVCMYTGTESRENKDSHC